MMRLLFTRSLLVLALFFGSAHHADAAIAYTVSPLVIDIDSEARDIQTRDIILTNTGTQPITVFPTVNNISLKDGGTIEEFLSPVESDRTTSLASWTEVSRRGVDVPMGGTHTFTITFRIDPNPKPGEYHAFIGFGVGRNRDEAEIQVKNGQAPGTLVNLSIEGKRSEFLKLANFIVERFVTSPENQAAVYTFTNPGNEVVIPEGEIIIYDGTGKEVGAVPVNEERRTIGPGEEYSFIERIPIEGLFGKYKAYLSVEYGNAQRAQVQDTNFFYAVPLKTLLIILSILAFLVILAAWYIHRKYLDDEYDTDSDRLTFHIRDTQSTSKEHDVNLKGSL